MKWIVSLLKWLNQDQRYMHLGTSVLLVIIGLLCIIDSHRLVRLIHILLTLYFLVSTIFALIRLPKYHDHDALLRLIVGMGGTIITVFYSSLLVSTFNILVGIYMILIALINFVDYYVRRKATSAGALSTLMAAVFSLVLGIVMMIFNSYDFYIIDLTIGIYFVLKGTSDLLRQIINGLPSRVRNDFYARFSLSAPVFMEALLPIVVYTSVKDLKDEYGCSIDDVQPIPPHSVEVWIHLNDHGFEQFGHVDVAYGSTIYSYGAHDPLSREVAGSVGKGVLLVVDRLAFLRFCVESGETILSYTLQLNEENEELLKKRIETLMADSQIYDCLLKRELDQGQPGKAHDYASRVYAATHAKMYTFFKGPFRWYYVFKTNCVQLADYLLRNGQFFLIQSSGIITPGSYITYLTQELRSEQGYVSELKIYSKE